MDGNAPITAPSDAATTAPTTAPAIVGPAPNENHAAFSISDIVPINVDRNLSSYCYELLGEKFVLLRIARREKNFMNKKNLLQTPKNRDRDIGGSVRSCSIFFRKNE